MEFIFFAGGVIVGTVVTTIFKNSKRTCGIIEVDHSNNLCKVHITSAELSDRKTKKAIFKIDHEANISQEEQGL